MFQRFGNAWIPLEKKSFGWVQPLEHRLLHLFVETERPPSPLWVVRRRENHLGWGLASTADLEDTRRTDLGLLQQLNGQYVAEHCHVATKHLYSEVQVVWTWFQEAGDLEEICIRCTGHSVPPGHVVLQNYPSFIPKESQHNLSSRWLCAEFFRFWWGGMAPFLARFLGFRLVVVDRGFISSNSFS